MHATSNSYIHIKFYFSIIVILSIQVKGGRHVIANETNHSMSASCYSQ